MVPSRGRGLEGALTLRVAFLMPGAGVVERGAEAFILELCSELAKREVMEITVFARGDLPLKHEVIGALSRDDRRVQGLYNASRLGRKILDTLFLDPLNLEWATASLSALPRLWSERFDLAVIEGGLVGGWVGRALRRWRGTRFVDIAHGNSIKWETAFARQRPDRVVTFTAAQASVLRRRAPRSAVEVIPHGVDLEKYRPDVPAVSLDLDRPVVLCVGAVDRQKRMHLAVEAVARLERGSLVVLGVGPDEEMIDQLAMEKLGERRYMRTRVPRREMPAWYAAADLFTLPSETEAFGLVYLEALACGVASVSPIDPVRQEILGGAALYIDVEDLSSYASTLQQALDRDWGETPRERAGHFPFSATVEGYLELFRELTR